MNPVKKKAIENKKYPRPAEPDPVCANPFLVQQHINRLSALAMIGKITPEVIHDINNHLTGILGYAELLLMKKIEDEGIKKGLKNISFSAEKCKVLLADLQSLSRSESSVRFGDVNEIIERTIELRKCALRHQQIGLVLDLEAKIPALAVDGIKFQKALFTMMFKAEEVLEKRTEGRKMVFKTSFDFLNQTVRVTLSANGFGMSPEGLNGRLEWFPGECPPGAGIGFDIREARCWINEMGGSLQIEFPKGEGPVFEVLLPIKGRD